MAELIIINPTKTMETMTDKTRVAAYVRVSSDSDDQENSFINQYDYYNKKINGNPDWKFVDIYADNGITGTEMSRRDEFNRMFNDCRDGKIDLVIVKSISRFARNTYDCLDTLRKLKVLGVDVLFEKENINTKTMKSETELAALSTMAQDESVSLSKNVRMGVQYRMKNGTFKQGCIPYGYYVVNDVWFINEEQANVVRAIFKSYIEGNSLDKIATELTKAGIPKGDGSTKWNAKRIGYIIRNERYKGDMLLQKTYTEDFPFVTKTNNGERDMYYIKNHHIGIVTEELYDKALARLNGQKKNFYTGTRGVKEHTLAKMMYCEECGTMFRRKSCEKTVHWVCRAKNDDRSKCPTPQIAEKDVKNGFVQMYNRLYNNLEYILVPMLTQLQEFRVLKLKMQNEIENINKEIAELTEQVHVLENAKANGYIEPASFMNRTNEIASRIAKLKKDKKLMLGNDECEKTAKVTERIINIMKDYGPMGEFKKEMFSKLIQRIWVDREKNIKYELINGLKLTMEYSEVS